MAKLYKTTGEVLEITPKNGVRFSLQELQELVGGYIEIIKGPAQSLLVLNDEGFLQHQPINIRATLVALLSSSINPTDYLVGDVVRLSLAEAGE